MFVKVKIDTMGDMNQNFKNEVEDLISDFDYLLFLAKRILILVEKCEEMVTKLILLEENVDRLEVDKHEQFLRRQIGEDVPSTGN